MLEKNLICNQANAIICYWGNLVAKDHGNSTKKKKEAIKMRGILEHKIQMTNTFIFFSHVLLNNSDLILRVPKFINN